MASQDLQQAVPFRYQSPLTEAPFARDTEAIRELYFPGGRVDQAGPFTIISEADVGQVLIQDLQVYTDNNQNGILDAGDTIEQEYTLLIFISRDVSYLQGAAEKTRVTGNQVCIFLEDNSGDIFSGTFGRSGSSFAEIFVGEHIRDSLDTWFRRNDKGSFDTFKSLEETFGFDIDITRRQMKRLVETGELRSTTGNFVISLLQIFNGLNILAAPVYDALGDFTLASTQWLRDRIKLGNDRWDPMAAGQDKTFSPFFLPFSPEQLQTLSGMGREARTEVVQQLQQGLQAYRAEINGHLNGFSRNRRFRKKSADTLKGFLDSCADYIGKMLDHIITKVNEVADFMSYMGERWLYMINALYCGLWNALVESILGIIDLVGYLFKGFALAGKVARDAQELIPKAMEMIDEVYQTFMQADLSGIFSKTVAAVIGHLHDIDFANITSAISLERVAYFIGGLLGFAVEILVGIFWSGGLDGIRATLQHLFADLGRGLIDFLEAAVKKATGFAAGFSTEALLSLLEHLLLILKKGATAVVELIDELFTAFKRGFQSVEEMLRQIMRMLQLDQSDMNLIKKMGLQFTGATDELCTLCKIPN